jgi:hypothetical protein
MVTSYRAPQCEATRMLQNVVTLGVYEETVDKYVMQSLG